MSVEELQFREEEELYPPRFVVTIRRSSAAEDCHLVFTFEGATEKITKQVILTKGIVNMSYVNARGIQANAIIVVI